MTSAEHSQSESASTSLDTQPTRRAGRAPSRSSRVGTRTKLIAAGGLTVALVAGGLAVNATLHKSFAIDLNGETIEAGTYASTVADVLDEHGISYDERDLIAPSPSSPIPDEGEIVVRHAKQIGIEVGGTPTTVWTTALDAHEAVAAVQARGDDAQLVASRSDSFGRASLELGLARAETVTVVADGARHEVATKVDTTVDSALSAASIALTDRDKVRVEQPEDTASPVVSVIRVANGERQETTEIAFTSEQRNDANLAEGKTKVVQAGVPGIVTTTYLTVLEDGVEVRRAVMNRAVTQEPVVEITAVGTKKPVAPSSGGGSAAETPGPGRDTSDVDGLNWAALAKCESGGNPSIVSKNGKYHGLYQFSVSTWKSVGGAGLPSQASSDEQTMRAKMLYQRSGAGQWPHCGKNLFR